MEAFVLASGPSLTAEDVELVRQWRSESYDRLVIVTNSTFRIALWADILFAMDGRWWNGKGEGFKTQAAEAKATFRGELVTSSQAYKSHGLTYSNALTFGNSGAGAVHLARKRGATRVYLLGVDCKANGKLHWHDDHKGMVNAQNLGDWPRQFSRLAAHLKGVEVFNCSRDTALKVFPRMSLEDATGGQGPRGRDVSASRGEASATAGWAETGGQIGLDGSVQSAPRNGTAVYETGGHQLPLHAQEGSTH